jgi:hypothetical protein
LISPRTVTTKGHSNDGHSMISPGTIATKSQNSRAA